MICRNFHVWIPFYELLNEAGLWTSRVGSSPDSERSGNTGSVSTSAPLIFSLCLLFSNTIPIMHLFRSVVMVKAHQPVWRTLQEARGPGEVGGSLDVFPAPERLRGYWLICGSSREPECDGCAGRTEAAGHMGPLAGSGVCVCVCVCVCVWD